MSNPYLYNPKILDIASVIPSDNVPFYFGGSQIPEYITNDISGNGLYKPTKKTKGIQSINFNKIRLSKSINIPSITHK